MKWSFGPEIAFILQTTTNAALKRACAVPAPPASTRPEASTASVRRASRWTAQGLTAKVCALISV